MGRHCTASDERTNERVVSIDPKPNPPMQTSVQVSPPFSANFPNLNVCMLNVPDHISSPRLMHF